MSLPAYGLQRKLAPDRHCLLRLMRRKRCRLPRSHTEIEKKLADLAWDPVTRRGVLLVTPPEIQVEDQLQRPRRSAFFLAAESEHSLDELHECLVKRLSSRKPS